MILKYRIKKEIMIMKNVKTKIASMAMASLMTLSAMSAMTVNVSADWNETDSGITYTDSRGNIKKGWQTIDGSRYFFGKDGVMRTGFRKIGGETYYFGKDGKMRTGDVKIKGKVYSFGKNGKLSGSSESVTLSADDVLKKLKNELGDSYTCDNVCTEDELESFFELDMSKVESCVYENSSISAVYMDTAVILKVKDGYAKTAASKLQERFDQIGSYSFLGHYDNFKAEQARLYVNGNYVALLILGKDAGENASEEDEKANAASEAEKIDAAWENIFGQKAENIIVLPEAEELEDGVLL